MQTLIYEPCLDVNDNKAQELDVCALICKPLTIDLIFHQLRF